MQSRPKTVNPIFDEGKRAQLHQLLHANLRQFSKSRSTWTLDLLAEVCWEQGSMEQVSRTMILFKPFSYINRRMLGNKLEKN